MRYHLYLIHILIEIKNKRNTRTFLHNYGKQILIQVNLIKKKFQMMK